MCSSGSRPETRPWETAACSRAREVVKDARCREHALRRITGGSSRETPPRGNEGGSPDRAVAGRSISRTYLQKHIAEESSAETHPLGYTTAGGARVTKPLPRRTLTIPRVFAVEKGLPREPPQSERRTPKPLPSATLPIHRVFTVSRGPGRKRPQSERGPRNPSPGRPLRSTVFSQSLEASGAKRRRVSEGPGGGPYFSTDFFEDVRSGMLGRTKKCRRGVHFEGRGRRTA